MTLTQTFLRSPLAAALTTPHGVDRYLELFAPMGVVNEVRARIVSIERETRAGAPVATVTLEPNRRWKGHEAGQYVQVGIEVDGRRRTRCFTVSSAESKPGDLITLTMRANPDGIVSRTWSRTPGPATSCSCPRRRASSPCPTRCPRRCCCSRAAPASPR